MGFDRVKEIIDDIDPKAEPQIKIIHKAAPTGQRLGVFSSSFNPPTIAHFELIRRAAESFSLTEVLALAGKTNADKLEYECSLEDRLAMIGLCFAEEPVSIGVSSHAFYVDMISALERAYPAQTDLHFIVGFDTFERVLDVEDRYTARYHREFKDRHEALEFLFSHSRLIVAGRGGSGLRSFRTLIEREPAIPSDRVFYMDFPGGLAELSATQVRTLRQEGESITGLVPRAVESFIKAKSLYIS